MKKIIYFTLLLLPIPGLCNNTQVSEKDTLVNLMREALDDMLEKKLSPTPYFVSMRVLDTKKYNVTYKKGKIKEQEDCDRGLTTQVRVGNMHLDNFGNKIKVKHDFMGKLPGLSKSTDNAPFTRLPTDCSSTTVVKNRIIKDLTETYSRSLTDYSKMQESAPLPFESFSKSPISTHYEAPKEKLYSVKDKEALRSYVQDIGRILDKQEGLSSSTVTLSIIGQRNIVLNTEGTLIANNSKVYKLTVTTTALTNDSKEESLTDNIYAYRFKELPSITELSKRIADQTARTLTKAQATVGEAYEGPVLFSAQASGVLMHFLVGFYLQAETWKVYLNPIQKRVNETILPEGMSISYNPTQKYWKGVPLMGNYQYDDEGTPAQSVECIKDGIFRQSLMGRAPVDAFTHTNGHARSGLGADPSPRQSNMFITSSIKLSEKELRNLFIQELKLTGKEYGYYVRSFNNDHHCGYRNMPAYPKPRELYKIYVDGRPDTPVRDMIILEDHWEMIRNIEAIGGTPEVTNGRCTYDNEELLTSVVSPMLYVKRVKLDND